MSSNLSYAIGKSAAGLSPVGASPGLVTGPRSYSGPVKPMSNFGGAGLGPVDPLNSGTLPPAAAPKATPAPAPKPAMPKASKKVSSRTPSENTNMDLLDAIFQRYMQKVSVGPPPRQVSSGPAAEEGPAPRQVSDELSLDLSELPHAYAPARQPPPLEPVPPPKPPEHIMSGRKGDKIGPGVIGSGKGPGKGPGTPGTPNIPNTAGMHPALIAALVGGLGGAGIGGMAHLGRDKKKKGDPTYLAGDLGLGAAAGAGLGGLGGLAYDYLNKKSSYNIRKRILKAVNRR